MFTKLLFPYHGLSVKSLIKGTMQTLKGVRWIMDLQKAVLKPTHCFEYLDLILDISREKLLTFYFQTTIIQSKSLDSACELWA